MERKPLQNKFGTKAVAILNENRAFVQQRPKLIMTLFLKCKTWEKQRPQPLPPVNDIYRLF
ncbi:MAG: hypothetical protein DRR16_06960 [Candidatus Parabeggiatoa sp. nov. 3]|nr:MAG: hypothetical protein DRR00_21215 [Gammaproteobacteria bacterium]RKZ66504.1 MAG: hypothetical protein DRQ99_09555 [Gammaproteobacteria bacterium]RKZ87594.1 MAG: hypothetical protein DRR16_06960 [Gammaproteobacteria bacterium]